MVEGHATIAVGDRDVDAESLLLPVDDELGPVYLVLNCDVFNGVVAREREAAPQEPHLVNVSIDSPRLRGVGSFLLPLPRPAGLVSES